MDTNELIVLLADGEYHSGESLGAALGGISRTAVWKQLKKLESLRLKLESRKGLGYRIVDGLDLLSEITIRQHLTKDSLEILRQISVNAVIDSTNASALQGIQQGVTHGALYLAEQQTAGRGRRGRTWISPFASNIYLSLVWQFTGGASVLGGLSLAVGVAVCRSLRGLGVSEVGLKWPNDIVINGKKLGGILLEMQGDAVGDCQVVIGIGINVAMGLEASQHIDQPWIDLQSLMAAQLPSRTMIVAAIVNELVSVLQKFQTTSFSPYRQEWMEYDVYKGREVMVQLGDNYIFGTSQGVDDGGALIILTPEGLKSFNGGEVSLRPAI